ncbi:Phosphoenolpyruvate synthase [Candidatus Lokiarchaeum ossiferum]|uniref:pyruvate, phosphate dikinase n=1 Tax=Candidatus Lokiarchaeum ossiferum TaxID=2951803 RepID=A0ABY6HRP1_9ARCH|nr:Phosphoenolpyruvate synthase [Candidatus Lokiarchaeum sp. B-35]
MSEERIVYMFDEVDPSKFKTTSELKEFFGGKGAGLANMTSLGLPIPYGFVIPCKHSLHYAEHHEMPSALKDQVKESIAKLEKKSGYVFGDINKPLLLSVRSGAPVSMPGMMDTVLNLGMSKAIAEKMAESNERFAWDSWRRFIMSYSDIVKETGREPYDEIMEDYKEKKGKKLDIELSAAEMKELGDLYLIEYKKLLSTEFPEDPWVQLFGAINAVFVSWDSERAVAYRKMNKIPNYGTAVNVMRMVFGNLNDDSGTGVLFTRSPMDGEKKIMGEFLINAQGEDVVAGVRTPMSMDDLQKERPEIVEEIFGLANKLEDHYKDMQDCEFTVENKKLFFLQTRVGKRTASAAVKIAIDMMDEQYIDEKTAVLRVAPEKIEELLHKRISPTERKSPIVKGFNASPGAVFGKAVFDCGRAIEMKKAGEKVILVRKETKPEDFPGMIASIGILTSRGGKTCHAAVVARGIGLPAIVGAGDLEIDEEAGIAKVSGEVVFKEGSIISIDGLAGNVYVGEVDVVDPEITAEFQRYLELCDKYRKLGVRTNADTPQMASDAIKNGAEGIGLCRTERMFNAEERLPKVVDMIVAESLEEREKALNVLLPLQKGDFKGIFKTMNGKPVTVRLLDPPLHEFLPDYKTMLIEFTELRVKGDHGDRFKELEFMIRKYEELKEENAMLGHRGVRLGNTNPEIYKMQARALIEALIESQNDGIDVHLEIMLPLVSHVNEFTRLVSILKPLASEIMASANFTPKNTIKWGTMIEIPRAALTSNEIAKHAEFFSFGTNDLTQMTYGFSRDDVESKFLMKYIDEIEPPIMKDNPFEHLDPNGVGKLVAISVKDGRSTRPNLKVGVCGETGGDPDSILLYHKYGLNYVSCSPFRVPVARVAAAHAAILDEQGKL